MKSDKTTQTGWRRLWVSAFAAVTLSATFADTHTVASGATETLSGVTETSAFVKSGDGTLILSGNNAMTRMQVAAGTLKFSGGTTTASDSTATGTLSHNSVFGQEAGATIIDGATLIAKDGAFVITCNGTVTVTNGTFDATGITEHFMNAFRNTTSECRIIINAGGVLKTKKLRPTGTSEANLKDKVSVDLNAGGELHVGQFWVDAKGVNRYGRINFNGGHVYLTMEGDATDNYMFNDALNRTGWTEGQTVPTILEGGCHIHTTYKNTVYPAFVHGGTAAKDGGLHLYGADVLYWNAGNSTYNGGTWLESDDGAIFALGGAYGDSLLGYLPATAETNIWVTGSNHTIFSGGAPMEIHPNRTIFVKDGKCLRAGAQGRLVIGGMIKGEASPGLEYPTNVYLEVRGSSGWDGRVVIGPGEGRTNDVGRILADGCLEVTSGVTRVASAKTGETKREALMYVCGNGSAYNEYKGHLIVSGGELYAPQDGGPYYSRYVNVSSYGQVDVVGGKVNMPGIQWLIGLNGPATLSISNGGEFVSGPLRIGQGSISPTTINLGKGGLLCPSSLRIEPKKAQDVTCLNWGYGKNHPFDKEAAQFAAAKRRFLICPGTRTWGTISGCVPEMCQNVDKAVEAGVKHGAAGYLMADWDDGGGVSPWIVSLPPVVYLSLRVRGIVPSHEQFVAEIDRVAGCRCGEALLAYGEIYRASRGRNDNATEMCYALRDGRNYKRAVAKGVTDDTLAAAKAQHEKAKALFISAEAPQWIQDDFALLDLVCRASEVRAMKPDTVNFRAMFEPEYRRLWLTNSRPGGLEESLKINFGIQ